MVKRDVVTRTQAVVKAICDGGQAEIEARLGIPPSLRGRSYGCVLMVQRNIRQQQPRGACHFPRPHGPSGVAFRRIYPPTVFCYFYGRYCDSTTLLERSRVGVFTLRLSGHLAGDGRMMFETNKRMQ